MRQSESIDKLAPALVAMQSEIEPVVKDSTNPHFKNRYLSLDAMTEYARSILSKHKLAVIQGGGDLTNGGLMVETTLIHESGQWISQSFEMPVEKATPQAAGSAITYGRRYGLAAFLALTTEEDDDGQAASKPRRQAAAKKDLPAITPESEITMRGKAIRIRDLSDAQLQWALEPGRSFGVDTEAYQAAFRIELAARDGGAAS